MRPANLVPAFCISVAVLVAEVCPFNSLPDPAPSLSGKTPVNVPGGLHSNAVCVVGTDFVKDTDIGEAAFVFFYFRGLCVCAFRAVAQVTGEDHALLGDEHTTECRRGMG